MAIMTFHAPRSLVNVRACVTRLTLSFFVSPYNIVSSCFPLLRFPSIILVVTRCSIFSLLITLPKKVSWRLCILFKGDVVMSASHNKFSLSPLQSIRFLAFSVGTIIITDTSIRFVSFFFFFFFFLASLKLPRRRIHTSG